LEAYNKRDATETIEHLLDEKYRSYSMYVIYSRAIPSIKDGLKLVQKRALWTAKDNAKDWTKVNTLSGIAVRLHPHGSGSIDDTISKMAQNFPGANNYTLFTGKSGFGSRLSGPGNGIGASRYVSVKISETAKKILLIDMELIKIIPSYDGEFTECENFLPIVPIALLNGITGMAVGYATEIQPYKIEDIIKLQKRVIEGKKLTNKDIPLPWFKGFNGKVYKDEEGIVKCRGTFTLEKNDLVITELPIGWNREQYVKLLDNLKDNGTIRDYTNKSGGKDSEEERFKFLVKLPKGSNYGEEDVIKTFKLESTLNQNLNLIDTKDKLRTYSNVCEIIEEFTNWRFSFYKKRYELLKKNLSEVISYNKELLKFIQFVIDSNYVKKMSTISKASMVKELEGKFTHIDKLLNTPIYHFNLDKIKELKDRIYEDEKQANSWDEIIKSENKQREIYSKELDSIKL